MFPLKLACLFLLFLLMLFYDLLTFISFLPSDLNQLTLPCKFLDCSSLHKTKPLQETLPHLFINMDHPLFLSEFPHFEFHLSLYFHYLDNLFFATPIL